MLKQHIIEVLHIEDVPTLWTPADDGAGFKATDALHLSLYCNAKPRGRCIARGKERGGKALLKSRRQRKATQGLNSNFEMCERGGVAFSLDPSVGGVKICKTHCN